MQTPGYALRVTLLVLKYCGLHPAQKYKISILSCTACFVVLTPAYILNFVHFQNTDNINEYTSCIEGFLVITQPAVVLISIVSYTSELQFLTHSSELLWFKTEITGQTKIKIEKNAYDFDKRALGFVIAVACGALCVTVPPVLNTNANLFLGGPVKKEYHLLLALLEFLAMCLSAVVVPTANILYAGLCVSFSMQFELLNVQLKDLFYRFHTADDQYKQIMVCIRRHNTLLQCVKTLRKALSLFFLTAITISMLTIFIECYKASENFDDFIKVAESALLVTCLIIQLALYCFPATNLTEASIEVSNAIFYSGWNECSCSKHLEYYVRMMIINAQKPNYLTAGGMMDINNETIVYVFKTSMSFFTMLRSLKLD